jgi:transposase
VKVGPCFAPMLIAAAVEASAEEAERLSKDDGRLQPMPAARSGLIEIDLGNRRIRVDAQVDPEALARVLDVLERR